MRRSLDPRTWSRWPSLRGFFSQHAVLIGTFVAIACLAALLSPFRTAALQNGDSAVYNEQVDLRDWGSRTTHFGYIVLGIVFRAILPGPTDVVMNWMTILLGCAGVGVVFITALRVSGSLLASAIAALALFAVPAYVNDLLMSEVNLPLAVSVALAFALWIHGHTLLAGLVYGFAMLISPLASLALPAFVFAPGARGAPSGVITQLKRLLVFGLVSTLVYLPVVAYHWADYAHGGRGILRAPRSPVGLQAHVARSVRFFDSIFPLLPFLALGAVLAIVRRAAWVVWSAAAVLVVSTLAGERFLDVPVQLPTALLLLPLLAMACATGPWWARSLLSLAAMATIGHSGYEVFSSTRHAVDRAVASQNAYAEIATATDGNVLFANVNGFSQARIIERVAFQRTYVNRALSPRELRRSCRALGRNPQLQIWFVRGSARPPCREMARAYTSRTRSVAGRRYRVLVPK